MDNEIITTNLKQFHLVEGDVLHALKSNEEEFRGFKEAYFSTINPYKKKGWKKHLKMTMNLIVPIGSVGFTFYDAKKNFLKNIVIGQENYLRITVPPNIWSGFKCLSPYKSYILNISNHLHDPKEVERKPITYLNFPS